MKTYQNQELDFLKDNRYHTTTDRYSFVDSKNIVSHLENKGLDFLSCSVAGTRKREKQGYQKHLLAFDTGHKLDDENLIRLLVVNSYDGLNSLKFMIGVYRVVCANGLIVGRDLFAHRIVHRGLNNQKIEEMLDKVHTQIPVLESKFKVLNQIEYNETQSRKYIKDVVQYQHNNKVEPLYHDFMPRRTEDVNKNLYNLYNMVQERVMKGLYSYEKEDGQIRKSRMIKSLNKNIDMNQFMFDKIDKIAA